MEWGILRKNEFSQISNEDTLTTNSATSHKRSPIPLIWFVGALSCLLTFTAQAILFKRHLKHASSVHEGRVWGIYNSIRQSLGIRRKIPLLKMQGLGSAAIVGLLRPKVIISPELMEQCDDEQIHSVLLHELTHYQQRHLLINTLGIWVCALHWFNPLVWILYHELRRSIELACDEVTIQSKENASPETYAHHLLDLMSLFPARPRPKLGFLGLFNNLNSKFIQKRILMIKQSTKLKLPITFVCCCGIAGLCLASTTLTQDASLANEQVLVEKQTIVEEPEATQPTTDDSTHELELTKTHIDQLNLDFDELEPEPNFSEGAKKFIKEEVLEIITEGNPYDAIEPLINSPYTGEAQIQFLIGNIYLQNNEAQKAELAYIKSINETPYARPLKNLILIYATTDHLTEARPLIEKYMKLMDEPGASIFSVAGVCAMQDQDYEAAIGYYNQSIILDEDSADVRENLLKTYLLMEKWNMAEFHLKNLIAQTDDSARLSELYIYYANIEIGKAEKHFKERAIEHFEKAIELNPNNSKAIEGLYMIENKAHLTTEFPMISTAYK